MDTDSPLYSLSPVVIENLRKARQTTEALTHNVRHLNEVMERILLNKQQIDELAATLEKFAELKRKQEAQLKP